MSDKHNPPLILIVDDQKPTTIMLERVFGTAGYQVHSVYDGESAIEATEAMHPDLILLDINLPGLSGFEVLQHLRKNPKTASIPAILITAMDRLSNVVQGLNLGADDYLGKPFHPQELLARAQSKMRARKLEEALQKRTEELEALLRAGEELSQYLKVDELLNVASQLIANLIPNDLVLIYYLDEKGALIDYRVTNRNEEKVDPPLDHQMIVRHLLPESHPLRWSEDYSILPQYANGLSVPMQRGSNLRGFFVVLTNQSPYDENQLRLLEGIGHQTTLALQNAELYDIQAKYAFHLEEMVAERTAELESAQQMLIRSEKLASVGRLAASVAHEINNPLLPIRINLEGMLEDVGNNRAISAEDIAQTLESVDRIKTIVTRLLGFTGKRDVDEADFDRLNINDAIESIVGLNRKFFQQENLTMVVDLAPLPLIYGSKYQLEHVFMNLVLNAKDAMGKGGVLTISSRVEADEIVVEFHDTGTGIRPEIIDRIFEPFVSTKEAGSGLGLFISYGIIQKHKGTVLVESKAGQGTRFTLRFPTAQSPPERAILE